MLTSLKKIFQIHTIGYYIYILHYKSKKYNFLEVNNDYSEQHRANS